MKKNNILPVPRKVLALSNLSYLQKLLIAEIMQRDKGEGALGSNKDYAEALCLVDKESPQVIANCISKLRGLGYIIDRKFDGRNRWISINSKLF